MQNINLLNPFKHMCITIGNLPTSYYESMTYYEALTWLVNYLQKEVIPAVNNNGEVVEELQDKYIELKNYVEHYFDTLDIQPQVDEKLDLMAQDGTLENLINQVLLTNINNKIDNLSDNIDNLENYVDEEFTSVNGNIGELNRLETPVTSNIVNAINSTNNNYIDEIKYKYSNNYELFKLPFENSFFNNLKIYKDKFNGNYKCNFNPELFKQTGGRMIYVNPYSQESSTTMDGTQEHPYNNIYKATQIMSNGDTIALFPGVYSRQSIGIPSASYIDKNINIVNSSNNMYDVILTTADNLSWVQDVEYSNVYHATRSNMANVIDIRNKNIGLFSKLKPTSSKFECSENLNTYYYSNSEIYINIGETPSLEKVVVSLNLGVERIQCIPTSQNINIYLDKLCCIGGGEPIFSIKSSTEYNTTLIANECEFLYSENSEKNAISVEGSDTIFNKCKACYGFRDGFNYHKLGNKKCNSIEIECIGSNNGLNSSQNNNNGSTTHDGNKILRFNGKYFNNKGGNITDVQTDTKSINIQCIAFDSKSTGTTSKGDFINQQAGCDMYLYNCYSKGSNSYINVYGVENTNIYISNSNMDTIQSEGNIEYID